MNKLNEIETLCNYFDMWADKPLCDTIAKLQDRGYSMRAIRKAYYHWVEES